MNWETAEPYLTLRCLPGWQQVLSHSQATTSGRLQAIPLCEISADGSFSLDSIYGTWSVNCKLHSGNLLMLTTQILSTCSCHAKPVQQHTKVINTGVKVACNLSKFGWCGCNKTLSCEVMARNFHQTNQRSCIQSPVSPSPPCPPYGPAKSTVPDPNRTNSH